MNLNRFVNLHFSTVFLALALCQSVFAQVEPAGAVDRANVGRTGVFVSPAVTAPGDKLWESEQLFVMHRDLDPSAVFQDYMFGTPGYENVRDALPGPLHSYYRSPIAQDGTIYFSAYIGDGFLYAVDAATGKVKWKIAQSKSEFTSPTLAGGLLYLGSGKFLHAINVSTQHEAWKYEATDLIPPLVSPLVANGTVYFGSDDGKLYALDAANGKEKWIFKTGRPVHWKPLVSQGDKLYAAESTGMIHALKVAPSQEEWTFKSPRGVWRIAADGDVLCVIDQDSNIQVLDSRTGKPLPDFRKHNRTSSEAALYDGKIYFGGWNTGSVFAIDAKSGERIWKFDLVLGCRAPALAGGLVFLTCADQRLYALDASTGNKVWSTDAKQQVMSAPFIAGGALYFLADDGRVHAIK